MKTAHTRSIRVAVSILAIALMQCSRPANADSKFTAYELPLGSDEHQSVLTGFLLDGAVAEIIVVDNFDPMGRHLLIYTYDGTGWTMKIETSLDATVEFVDVARIGGRDRLLTYGDGQVRWFDPGSKTYRPLMSETSNFKPPHTREVPHVDLSHDVNGDGLDDLVIPDVDGFSVYVQSSGGSFSDPVKIGPYTRMDRIYGADGYRFDPWGQSRVHAIDYNTDGRSDLVYWSGNHFDVHLQSASGLFDPLAKPFTTPVAFESDDLSSLATGTMTGRVLYSLSDINGDGLGDLIVLALTGNKISVKESRFEVYFGLPGTDGGTEFSREAGLVFRADDSIPFSMTQRDFDGDGQRDIMITSIDRTCLSNSLWKTMKGFMGDDIKLNLAFYRQQGGSFSSTPVATHRVGIDGEPSHREPGYIPLDIVLRGGRHEMRLTQSEWPRAFNRPILLGDANGDGHENLFLGHTPDGFDVHKGLSETALFSRKPEHTVVPMPSDEEFIWLADMNRDGKQDVLLHFPARGRIPIHPDAVRQPSRVTVLMAQ